MHTPSDAPQEELSNSSFTLFIGDLSIFCTETMIENAFKQFGDIKDVRIKCDEKTKKNLSYGFVEFVSVKSAVAAMNEMNNKLFYGRKLKIRWAANKNAANENEDSGGLSDPQASEGSTCSIHVNFMTYQTSKVITEETLCDIFGKYGEIVDAQIKKSIVNEQMGFQKGYAFVHFSDDAVGYASAMKVISDLYDTTIDNVNYKCALSKLYVNQLERNSTTSSHNASPSRSQLQYMQQHNRPASWSQQSHSRVMTQYPMNNHQQQLMNNNHNNTTNNNNYNNNNTNNGHHNTLIHQQQPPHPHHQGQNSFPYPLQHNNSSPDISMHSGSGGGNNNMRNNSRQVNNNNNNNYHRASNSNNQPNGQYGGNNGNMRYSNNNSFNPNSPNNGNNNNYYPPTHSPQRGGQHHGGFNDNNNSNNGSLNGIAFQQQQQQPIPSTISFPQQQPPQTPHHHYQQQQSPMNFTPMSPYANIYNSNGNNDHNNGYNPQVNNAIHYIPQNTATLPPPLHNMTMNMPPPHHHMSPNIHNNVLLPPQIPMQHLSLPLAHLQQQQMHSIAFSGSQQQHHTSTVSSSSHSQSPNLIHSSSPSIPLNMRSNSPSMSNSNSITKSLSSSPPY